MHNILHPQSFSFFCQMEQKILFYRHNIGTKTHVLLFFLRSHVSVLIDGKLYLDMQSVKSRWRVATVFI